MMTTPNNYRKALFEKTKSSRIKLCSNSIWAFAKMYLPKLFSLPPSIMHKEVSRLLVNNNSNRNTHMAIAEPCGYQLSKLTCLAHILWAICYNREKFIAVVCLSDELCKDLIKAIKLELNTNMRIKQDFPHAFGRNSARWNRNEIITRNNIKLVTANLMLPEHESPKNDYFGYKYEKPSLIIFDDITYSDEFRHNPFDPKRCFRYYLLVEDRIDEIKLKLFNDLTEIIEIQSDSATNILVTGNMDECCDVIGMVIEEPKEGNWILKSYPAILKHPKHEDLWQKWLEILAGQLEHLNSTGPASAYSFFQDHKGQMLEGTQVLWPEFEDYYSLMLDKWVFKGQDSFECKKLNCDLDKYISKLEAGLIEQRYDLPNFICK